MKKTILLIMMLTLILTSCGQGTKPLDIELSDETSESTFKYTKMLIPDLEQGRAIFFELPTKEYVLADCGAAEDYPKLFELIRAFGINTIDYVILTSEASSSMGGIEKLLSDFKVGEVCVSTHMKNTQAYNTICSFAGQNNTEVSLADENTRIYDFGTVCIDVISSDPCTTDIGTLNAMTIMLTHGSKKILIEGPGDIVSENKMISAKSRELMSDILIVSNCGAGDTPSELFLQTVNPDCAVIPVHSGKHPSNPLLDRLDNRGVSLLRTDNDGTLQFILNGEDYVYKKER